MWCNNSSPVASNEWGTLTYHTEWKTMELRREQTTRSMSDEGFRQTLQLLADKGLELAPDAPALFPTGWFESRDKMYAWGDCVTASQPRQRPAE